METYNRLPVIFTKDPSFAKSIEGQPLGPGSVVVLPHDAILVFEPEIITQSAPDPFPLNIDLENSRPMTGEEIEDRDELAAELLDSAPKEPTKIPVVAAQDETERKTVYGLYVVNDLRNRGHSKFFDTFEEAEAAAKLVAWETRIDEQTYTEIED